MGKLEGSTIVELNAVVYDPSGAEAERQRFVAERGDYPGVSIRHNIVALRFTASAAGIWHIAVVSGNTTLGTLPVEIKLRA